MRLAAQRRGGFYPAHEKAVAFAASFLRPPTGQAFAILDPCSGEGAAIKQLAGLLGCPPAMTYAIELDESRAQTLRSTLPDAQVLGPANFLGCRASMNSFSLIWLNSPFGDGYGGHRVEEEFLQRATDWLKPQGVMALVCPEDVVEDYSGARFHFMTYFDRCRIVPFPSEERRYKEVILFAHKRAKPNADARWGLWEKVQAPEGFVYHIPPGAGPRVFQKVEPTEEEVKRMLAESPLRSHLLTRPRAPLPSPPLALGIGHVALLLASGHLDGVVQPANKPAHVVRGSSRKTQYVSEIIETENQDGSTTTKTILSERIELVVRTVDVHGRLRTFLETDAPES